MIIVAGSITVAPERRDDFLARSMAAVAAARATPACHDFVVAADPIDADRVNVYERWASPGALESFRGEGSGPDLDALIVGADVADYEVRPATS